MRPLTVEEFGQEAGPEQYVAENAGRVVGHLGLRSAWWTGRADVYAASITVDRERWSEGIGSQLYDHLLERAGELHATRLIGWVREDVSAGRIFAAQRGFEPTGEVVEEYRLDLAEANTAGCLQAEERLAAEGIGISRLSEIELDDPFLRRLQQLWADSGDIVPDAATLAGRFDTWRQEVLLGPGLSPNWHWVALDGFRGSVRDPASMPVGMSFLKMLGPDAAENDYTGVASDYRRRGIARALKCRVIDWARHKGLRWLYTSSAIDNEPMLSLNRNLGYLPTVRRVELAKEFYAVS